MAKNSSARMIQIAWAASIAPLLGFWLYGLFDLDEGYYAAVVGEMNRRGEWITPFYNGAPWFEKPILLYWLAKPSVLLFGQAIGPRLPAVLCAIGVLATIYAFGKRFMGLPTAVVAMLILASSLLFVGVSRMMLTDLPLLLSLSLAFLAFYRSLVEDYRWRWLTALFLGVSVLAKGPVGCALFVLLAAWTYWKEPSLRPAFARGWLIGTVIFVGAVAIWYAPAYLINGRLFVDEFLIKQNLARFTGGDAAHVVPMPLGLLFYPTILALGFAPWWFWTRRAWPKRSTDAEGCFQRYLARWALAVLLFFTLSSAKLPHYILPCLPPLALLVGDWIARRRHDYIVPFDWQLIRLPLAMCAASFVVANAGFFIYYYGLDGLQLPGLHAEVHSLARWLKDKPGEVAMYQMSRRQKGRGTGTASLQETTHPSVLFYLDRNALETDDFSRLTQAHLPLWVLTRQGRFTPEEIQRDAEAGYQLILARSTEHYCVFKLSMNRESSAPRVR